MSAAKNAAHATVGPCLECGDMIEIIPVYLHSAQVDGRAVPFLRCFACRDAAHERWSAALRKDGPDRIAAHQSRERTRERRRARRYLDARVMPVARALIANTEAAS